jgi:hypothetical protein
MTIIQKTVREIGCATLLVAVAFIPASATAAATQNFVTVTLPKGVSIELPRNWVVLSNNQQITLDTSVESRLDLSGINKLPSELAFAANLYDDRGRTLAILNIRYYPELGLSQADARRVTSQDLKELDSELKQNITKAVQSLGMSITSWNGTTKAEINGITVFVTEYRRASFRGSGNFRVRLVRVFAGNESFTLTVSYLESASMLLQPITDRIIRSMKLASVVPMKKQQGLSSFISDVYGEELILVLIVSLFWTWGIGLAPAVLIRFVIMRRPITKLSAIVTVAIWWAAMLIVGNALGSQNGPRTALVLVAIASYAILRKGGKNSAGFERTA